MKVFLKLRNVLVLILVLIAVSFLVILNSDFEKKGQEDDEGLGLPGVIQAKSGPKRESNVLPKRQQVILFYTNLWGTKPWQGFESSDQFNNWRDTSCKVQNCVLIYNNSQAAKADVILFHGFGRDMVSQQELTQLSAHRHPNQVWIYFMHECPHNAIPSPNNYNGFFNWTMNYRRDADIIVPYNWEWGTWEQIPPNEPRLRKRDYAKSKDKLAYAIISHCGLLREKYIKQLQKYIPVDVYGKCSNHFHQPQKVCKRNNSTCDQLKKRYKFFLAFENSFCTDYITEKFYQTILDGDAVPITMGGADYKSLAIENSYIDALDFNSVEDLANHLKYLDKNDVAYNEHQKWRENYKLGKPRSWSCEICRMANEKKLLRKSYPDLGNWYSAKNGCGKRVNKLRSIMEKSNVTKPYTDQYYKIDDSTLQL